MTNEAEERARAEQEYTITAFDYQKDPVGSRDWTLFWKGWQAARAASPVSAPTEWPSLANPDEMKWWQSGYAAAKKDQAVAPVSAERG